MLPNGFTIDFSPGNTSDACVETAVHGVMQGSAALEEQVTQLFELLRDPVFFYLMALLRDADAAEDLTQETFLKLYRALHQHRPIQNVRFWLFRVAHNLACDYRKQDLKSDGKNPAPWEEIAKVIPDPGLNPEQRVLQMEKFEKLHAALAWLSPQELQCLHLRAEGFRYREIGAILGINTKTVAEYLRRGVGKLMREQNG